MREKFEVTYISGDVVQVTAYYPDFCDFEEVFDKNPIIVSFDQFRMTNQGFIAFAALVREGRVAFDKPTKENFDAWRKTIENVKMLDEEEVEHAPLESDQHIGS
jgi:hypothetical protein